MKANKRIRDLARRSGRRLFVMRDGAKPGTTTFPIPKSFTDVFGRKVVANRVQVEAR